MNGSTGGRLILPLILFIFLTTYVPARPLPDPPQVETAALGLAPVPLDAADPSRRRLGRLTYLGGWVLESPARRFGGLSAMHVEARLVTAVSDAGTLIRFPVPQEPRSVPVTLASVLHGSESRGDKRLRDAEGLLIEGSKAWVVYESSHAVRRYGRDGFTPEAAAHPAAMRPWPANGGGEAIVRLADGRFLIFAERQQRPDGTAQLLLFEGDPAEPGTEAASLGYRPPSGYRPTDAAMLPDGRMLVLNRRFSILGGFSARLVLVDLPPLEEGAVLQGAVVAAFDPPVATDNLEAISVTQEDGRTIVWLASDDNFNRMQRTLLLKFALDA